MARRAAELKDLQVKAINKPGRHAVGGVPGLELQVLPTGIRTWILRFMINGRRRAMGLGGYPEITLKAAREAAREARDLIRKGEDPIDAKRRQRSEMRASAASFMTFRAASEAYIKAHESGWKSPKHAGQWAATLEAYA